MQDKEFSWEISEYAEKDRSVDWYWGVGIALFIIIVVSLWQHNYLFALLMIIGVGTLLYLTVRKPEVIEVTVTNRGIRVRNEFYFYKSIKAFWVEHEPQPDGEQHLLLLTARTYSPIVAIPIGSVAPDKIRQALLPHLEEQELRESVSHKFIEMFGF